MKNIKIVFFDIDGTLVPLDKDDILDKSVFALNKLKKMELKFVLQLVERQFNFQNLGD